MKKITLKKIVAAFSVAAMTISTSFAQQNLGAECGCPPVSSRTPVTMSSLGINANGELLASQILTCDNVYTLDVKIYVPNGLTLTIQPGTVIKGASAALPANATALIIERGGKIIADGTEACPIVFTSVADPMDGNYSLTNVGEWGGIALLGKGVNNLKSGDTYCTGTNGVGFIEGFAVANIRNHYGAGDAAFPTADNADNSGILRYVSIRHAGAIIAEANELNGLSLGSVGSGTTIEHLEIIANADDNIEFFGGAVNVKYVTTLFGDDDMFDWDLGWVGKAQFLFGIQSDSVTGVHSGDSGFECDADDNKTTPPSLRSHPKIYNATVIGNNRVIPVLDNTGPAGIMAKEFTEGEIYNSIFANFRSGLHLATARSTSTNGGDAYDNWTNDNTPYNSGTGIAVKNSLKVKNNTFIGFGNTPTHQYHITKGALTSGKNATIAYKAATPASAADLAQFTADGNVVTASVPGIDYNWAWNNASHYSYSNNSFHVTPTANLSSSITPPADGFFSTVNYRGAFDATKSSWLSEWAFAQVLSSQQSNPTDLNNDGITSTPDFNIFVGKFGQVNQ